MGILLRATVVLSLAMSKAAFAEPTAPDVAVVGAGTYAPLFSSSGPVAVRAFAMDRKPVTNTDYLAFVRGHSEWRRDRVQGVFADAAYLSRWAGPDEIGAGVDPMAPVVDVSWFAARAYCASRGMRLPTEAEWEHAAAASHTSPDGSSDPAWRSELMALYSRPGSARLPRVASGVPNVWGIYDLHGLVWEWVNDFNASTRAMDCGSTAAGSSPVTDFAAFQRAAFRSSLRASYTTHNLGFRCAMDAHDGDRR